MKKRIAITILSLLTGYAYGQQITAYKADDIIQRASSADTVYVINFWATWCLPCVEELPEFDVLAKQYAGKPVKILMISLDFKENYPMKLQMFAQRKRMVPEVGWLAETDPNKFIPKIEESWQGSIPATLIVRPGKMRKFIEGQITAAQIGNIVDGVMK